MTDRRTYRTELEQPSACGGRWGLYVDGHLIARSNQLMDDIAARDWANSQLGEGFPGSTGAPTRQRPGTGGAVL